MKYLAVFMFSFTAILALGQSGDAVFTVKAKPKIYLTPHIDSLFAGRQYHFQLTGFRLKDISSGSIANGSVLVTDTDLIVMTDTAYSDIRQDFLMLYTKKNGKEKLVLTKRFDVIKLPGLKPGMENTLQRIRAFSPLPPPLFWLRDDTVSVSRIVPDNFLEYTQIAVWPESVTERIIAFSMEIECGENSVKLSSMSAKLTKPMIAAIKNIKPGCKINLYDIRCIFIDKSNDISILEPHTILINE